MNKLQEPLVTDFRTIRDYLYNLFCISIDGDKSKLRQFPQEPLMRKALSLGPLRVYLFDEDLRLVMFILEMSIETTINKLIPFEKRYSLNLKESPSTSQKKSSELNMPRLISRESLFSMYVFGGPHLIRTLQIDPTGAVVFALLFGYLNTLSHDQATPDIVLSLEGTSF